MALNSVLKADVWRDHFLAGEVHLNVHLTELDATPPGELEVRIDEAKDEVSGWLAAVHVSLADMEAESRPARAAALLGQQLPSAQYHTSWCCATSTLNNGSFEHWNVW